MRRGQTLDPLDFTDSLNSKLECNNWGPETLKLRNMTWYDMKRLGINGQEFMLLYYALTQPRFWVKSSVFSNWRSRYYVELTMNTLRVAGLLAKMRHKIELYQIAGIDPSELSQYVPRTMTRKHYFPLAEHLGKIIPPEVTFKATRGDTTKLPF